MLLRRIKGRLPRRTFFTTTGLLLAVILLAGCAAPPPESPSPSPPGEVSATPAPTQSPPPPPVFEGVVGQDWYEVTVPLFDEVGGVSDLTYALGKLWAVSEGLIHGNEGPVTPALLNSSDGIHWESVDLKALGLPDNASGQARLLGSEDQLIMLIENQQDGATIGDVPQTLPWVLRGDGETWQVIGEEQFGPWQVNARDSGKYLNYQEIVALAQREGDIILMPSIGWFEPYQTADLSIGLGWILPDGTAQMVADYDDPPTIYNTEYIIKMLVYQGDYLVFANSLKSRREGIGQYFNLWHSTDGRIWSNYTPALPDQMTYTWVNDAVIGPVGLVAVGWEAPQKPDSEYWDTPTPIALLTTDGENWEKTGFGPEGVEEMGVTATDSAYYAYDAEGFALWHSADGESWKELAPLTLYQPGGDGQWTAKASSYQLISKVLGMPEGLVALGGSTGYRGRTLLFSGTLPFDYLNP